MIGTTHDSKTKNAKTYLTTQYSSINQSQGVSNLSSFPQSVMNGEYKNSRALADSKRYSSIKHSQRDASAKKARSKDSRGSRVSTAGKTKILVNSNNNTSSNHNNVNFNGGGGGPF